jgi:hypothetical protein
VETTSKEEYGFTNGIMEFSRKNFNNPQGGGNNNASVS